MSDPIAETRVLPGDSVIDGSAASAAPVTSAKPVPYSQLNPQQKRTAQRTVELAAFGNENLGGLGAIFAMLMGFANEESFQQWREQVRAGNLSSEDAAAGLNYSRFDFESNSLLNMIAEGESGGDYNIAWGRRHPTTADGHPLSDMTINEVLAWQKSSKAASDAAGKYQIIEPTLRASMKAMGLTGNEKFDPAMQDRIAMHLLEQRGLSKYLAGNMSKEDFLHRVSQEWAAVPDPKKGGRSHYAGDGLNAAGNRSVAEFYEALEGGNLRPGSYTSNFNGQANPGAGMEMVANLLGAIFKPPAA